MRDDGRFEFVLAQNALKKRRMRPSLLPKRFRDKEQESDVMGNSGNPRPRMTEILKKNVPKECQLQEREGSIPRRRIIICISAELAFKCTVFPNLNDKELQDSLWRDGGGLTFESYADCGQYANYLEKVQAVNGFDVPMDELVSRSKTD